MTTADFTKYKAIVIPDCLCNTSLSTIKFLDDTKRIWSPAVTGNMVLIGTDPSFHAKWFNLPGAYAMMQDALSLVSTGKNGTGMYFSLSCYYQSNATAMPIEALSEIGDFQVRGNLSHPCLNNAHLVAKSSVMTSLNDDIASNWNCSVHEVFSEYPRSGPDGFEALAIALNATGIGARSFADNTSGIPNGIQRGMRQWRCQRNPGRFVLRFLQVSAWHDCSRYLPVEHHIKLVKPNPKQHPLHKFQYCRGYIVDCKLLGIQFLCACHGITEQPI
ncbi:hypothetical protein B0H67DRAFT_641769 [Lasiosphaeris hirsuta]|uniref:Uncharacterized protein n=1 Tax=Lasiosphaeris hirsuta TaxID=260670 RepID=A0AA40E7J4_9PEZI|nr:hypothetical protein B0H67DRAFT_641769 [Lasiosphaeris hirsuta]